MAIEIFIPKNQPPRAIYSDGAAKVLGAVGQTALKRASHVEPSAELSDAAIKWLIREQPEPRYFLAIKSTSDLIDTPSTWDGFRKALSSDKWWADMLPSGGPVLGPFTTRDEAINTELVWLREHGVPTAPAAAPAMGHQHLVETPLGVAPIQGPGPFPVRSVLKPRAPTPLFELDYPSLEVPQEPCSAMCLDPPRIQIETPTTPVILPDGSELHWQKDASILHYRDGRLVETRWPSVAGYEEWASKFQLDRLGPR